MINIDDEVFEWVKKLYEEVLMLLGIGVMVQCYYVVVSWFFNVCFVEKVCKFGEGCDGWWWFMVVEIEFVQCGLYDVYFGEVVVFMVCGIMVVIWYMQNFS